MWFNLQTVTATGQVITILGVALVAYEHYHPRSSERTSPGTPYLSLLGVGCILGGLGMELAAGLLWPP